MNEEARYTNVSKILNTMQRRLDPSSIAKFKSDSDQQDHLNQPIGSFQGYCSLKRGCAQNNPHNLHLEHKHNQQLILKENLVSVVKHPFSQRRGSVCQEIITYPHQSLAKKQVVRSIKNGMLSLNNNISHSNTNYVNHNFIRTQDLQENFLKSSNMMKDLSHDSPASGSGINSGEEDNYNTDKFNGIIKLSAFKRLHEKTLKNTNCHNLKYARSEHVSPKREGTEDLMPEFEDYADSLDRVSIDKELNHKNDCAPKRVAEDKLNPEARIDKTEPSSERIGGFGQFFQSKYLKPALFTHSKKLF